MRTEGSAYLTGAEMKTVSPKRNSDPQHPLLPRHSITQPLIVLAVYGVIGILLVYLFSLGRLLWWRGQKDTGVHRSKALSPEEEVGIAAVPPG